MNKALIQNSPGQIPDSMITTINGFKEAMRNLSMQIPSMPKDLPTVKICNYILTAYNGPKEPGSGSILAPFSPPHT
jgi:hypothetical protein